MKLKPLSPYELGLVVVGMLYGFAFGIFTYMAFFRLPGESKKGVAGFVAIICLVAGFLLRVVIRRHAHRDSKTDEKRDA
jgi:high-affinity Fe2+/Pb2+ permease